MATILVIDDNLDVLAAIVLMLGNKGHQVTAMGSAQYLREIATAQYLPEDIDVVVVDMVMPEVDGVEAIRAIRTLRPSARVIAISGGSRWRDSVDYLHLATRFGAVAALEKPFSSSELDAAVRRAIAPV
jgi:CheY-like chemotaxis protein